MIFLFFILKTIRIEPGKRMQRLVDATANRKTHRDGRVSRQCQTRQAKRETARKPYVQENRHRPETLARKLKKRKESLISQYASTLSAKWKHFLKHTGREFFKVSIPARAKTRTPKCACACVFVLFFGIRSEERSEQHQKKYRTQR